MAVLKDSLPLTGAINNGEQLNGQFQNKFLWLRSFRLEDRLATLVQEYDWQGLIFKALLSESKYSFKKYSWARIGLDISPLCS